MATHSIALYLFYRRLFIKNIYEIHNLFVSGRCIFHQHSAPVVSFHHYCLFPVLPFAVRRVFVGARTLAGRTMLSRTHISHQKRVLYVQCVDFHLYPLYIHCYGSYFKLLFFGANCISLLLDCVRGHTVRRKKKCEYFIAE